MRAKLLTIVEKSERLSAEMGQQEVASVPSEYQKRARAQSEIQDVVQAFRAYLHAEKQLVEAEELLHNEKEPELRAMAEEERADNRTAMTELEEQLRLLLLPKDPNDAKNTIVEIRAGTGGDEAGLFVADMFNMYSRYAEVRGWKIDVLNSNETGIGGFKEITFKVEGENVFSQLKFEGGVHRVQRVPETEAQGRVHTSAVTVAVLPEAEEVEVDIDAGDLIIDVFRSTGPGGQSVNTTDSAVRITHKPTGLVVTCQDEKSQHKNKAKAMLHLRARLLAKKQEEEAALRSADRRSQVGSGDRSERIRTYNFPQNRLTDHRINYTSHSLDRIIEGDLQGVIDQLVAADRAAKLSES